MARLYDRLLAGDYLSGSSSSFLEGLPVIVADNVSDYFWSMVAPRIEDEDEWDDSHFPNLAPPLDTFWIECRSPDANLCPGWSHEQPQSMGAIVDYSGRDDPLPGGVEKHDLHDLPPGHWLNEGGWRWVAQFVPVLWDRAHGIYGNVIRRLVPVASDGRIYPHKRALDICESEEATDWCRQYVGMHIYPLWLAISFMHCRNVDTRNVSPPEALSKKWERKHGRPQVTYKVLDIDPMKETLESEGGASENGLKRALHICRGHFAHYPEGLFNRGDPETVWKPQHVRGSPEAGAVVKDYNVKAGDA